MRYINLLTYLLLLPFDACLFVLYLIYFLCCGVKVVSPCYRRWCSNLNEPLDPFPFLGDC